MSPANERRPQAVNQGTAGDLKPGGHEVDRTNLPLQAAKRGGDDESPQQMPLPLWQTEFTLHADVAEPPDQRVEDVAEWIASAHHALEALARDGAPFTAEDVRRRRVGEPLCSCRWGQLFSQARKEGLIEKIATTSATRRSRHSSLLTIWRGTAAVTGRAAETSS